MDQAIVEAILNKIGIVHTILVNHCARKRGRPESWGGKDTDVPYLCGAPLKKRKCDEEIDQP